MPACSRLAGAALSCAALLLAACPSPQAKDSSEAAAVVNGQTITLAELDAHIKDNLFDDASGNGDPAQLYELRSGALDSMIDDALLADAAKKAGKTPDQLLEEAEANAGEVSFSEVSDFFERIKGRLGDKVKLDDVADQIRARLEAQRKAAARQEFLASLRKEAAVSVAIEPPRIEVEASGPSLGPEDAPVTIVEFSDFQCPFCKRVNPTVEAIAKRFPKQVRIVYRHFPLDSIHPQARAAAEAAVCADDQGGFWKYHDLLFAGPPNFPPDRLEKLAGEAGLDVAAFKQCLADGSSKERVDEDAAAGHAAGVNGTPAFFVNGIPLSGAQPLDKFVEVIESELARSGAKDAA